METKAKPGKRRPAGAAMVALGIFFSRIMGLVRQKVFAFYFGNSDIGDAFYAALKIPNFPQNLLGDGVLSASFIPIYTKLLAENRQKEADEVAGIIGSLLAILNTLIVGIGVLATPWLIDLIAPGFSGEKRQLTIYLVQIFFPGTGLLVMSAWCLGILNSHRKFFLSYVAPVVWNLAIIAALLIFGAQQPQEELVVTTAWAVLVGSLLQLLVQLPSTIKYAPKMKWWLTTKNEHVQQIFKNFTPVVAARGVVQISAYIDTVIASLLPGGAVANIAYAQSLYMLPISLFGMSVSAAELPTMSSSVGSQQEIAQAIQERMIRGLRQIAFFVIPSLVGFWAVGDIIVAALYEGGLFGKSEILAVWTVLLGYTVGLLANTWGRLYSSAFYAFKDTRTPLRFAILRVSLATVFGTLSALKLPAYLNIDPSFGAAGLTASAGIAAWIEFYFLRRSLMKKIGSFQIPKAFLLKIWSMALISGSCVWWLKSLIPEQHPLMQLSLVLGAFALVYFPMSFLLQIPESNRIKRFFKK